MNTKLLPFTKNKSKKEFGADTLYIQLTPSSSNKRWREIEFQYLITGDMIINRPSTFIIADFDLNGDIYGVLEFKEEEQIKYVGFKFLKTNKNNTFIPETVLFKTYNDFSAYLSQMKEYQTKNLISLTHSISSIPIIIPLKKILTKNISENYIKGLFYTDKYLDLLCYKETIKQKEDSDNEENKENVITIHCGETRDIHTIKPSNHKIINVEDVFPFLFKTEPTIIVANVRKILKSYILKELNVKENYFEQ